MKHIIISIMIVTFLTVSACATHVHPHKPSPKAVVIVKPFKHTHHCWHKRGFRHCRH